MSLLEITMGRRRRHRSSSQQDPILQQQQHKQPSASSKTRTRSRDLLFLEENATEESLTTETTKKNPLLVLTEEDVVGDAHAADDDNGCLISERKSAASLSPPLIERMELIDEDTLIHASTTDVKEEQRTSEHENHPLRDVTSVLQSDLANILYRLRRVVSKTNTTTATTNQRKRMAPIVEPFLQTHRGDRQRRLVWESLLDALALQQQRQRHWNPQSSPEVRLGLYTMMTTMTIAITAEDKNNGVSAAAAADSPSAPSADVVEAAAAAAAASTIDPAFLAFLREATISQHHHDGDEGKTTRSRLLAAVNLLDVWLMTDDVENNDKLLSSLVDRVVPLLASSVTNASSKNAPLFHHSGNKPTVLANRTIDVVYRIVTEAAQRAIGGGPNAATAALEDGDVSVSHTATTTTTTASAQLLAASVWRQAEAVDALWDWQLAWLLQRSPTTTKTTTLTTTEDENDDHCHHHDCWNWSRFSSSKEIQRRCQAAVLADWHQHYQNFCERMETLQNNVADTTDSAMEEAHVHLDWCRCLSGGEAVLLRNSRVEGVVGGSLSQTLSSSLAPASKEQVMGMFVQYDALAVATDERIGSNTACSRAVRALVAWIGQKRKHLGLLERSEVQKLSGWLMEGVASENFHCMDIVVAAL